MGNWRRRPLTVVVCAAAAAAALSGPTSAEAAAQWGPVVTVYGHGLENPTSVTTDNGMVVAAWSGPSFNNLYIAVRRLGIGWSSPTRITTDAGAVSLARDGSGAWLLWQGFDVVSALHVQPDGVISAPHALGPSSDPFVSDAEISAGANGAVAAVWHQTGTTARIAYRPRGGDWGTSESVPVAGYLEGLDVDSGGAAQLVISTNQGLTYLRRSAGGTWGGGFVVSTVAKLPTVTGNPHGDMVIGWQIDNGDGTFSLAARYRSAEGGFKPTQHLADGVPYGTSVALAMGGDGAAAAAYQTSGTGAKQIQLTPTDPNGSWLDAQDLALTGSRYDVAMNTAGDFVVASLNQVGSQLVRCGADDVCGATETHLATKYRFPSISLGPHDTITLVWGTGCQSEECLPTRLVAQSGR